MAKHRFVLLDGFRGIAALFVLFGHTGSYWHFHLHGYLGADLFFILSGFVLSYAYDDRLLTGRLRFWDFFKLRIIRLYPFFCLGAILGTADMMRAYHTDLPSALIALGCSLLMLPSRAHGVPPYLYPVNPPFWTLLFELFANFAYAATRRFLTDRVLIGALVLLGVAISVGSLTRGDLNYGYLWGINGIFGIPRAMFGFGLGLLLYRRRDFVQQLSSHRFSPAIALALLLFAMCFTAPAKLNGLADLIAVAIVLPLIVALGATQRVSRFDGFLAMLGAASYPVYVLHVPVAGLTEGALHGLASTYAPLSGIVFVSIFYPLCAAAEQKLDVPLRRMLTNRLLPKREATAEAATRP